MLCKELCVITKNHRDSKKLRLSELALSKIVLGSRLHSTPNLPSVSNSPDGVTQCVQVHFLYFDSCGSLSKPQQPVAVIYKSTLATGNFSWANSTLLKAGVIFQVHTWVSVSKKELKKQTTKGKNESYFVFFPYNTEINLTQHRHKILLITTNTHLPSLARV